MNSHFKTLCPRGHIISQCRCPGAKRVDWSSDPCRCPEGTPVDTAPGTPTCGRCGSTRLVISDDVYSCPACMKHDRENAETTEQAIVRRTLQAVVLWLRRESRRAQARGGDEAPVRGSALLAMLAGDLEAHERARTLPE